MGVNVDKFKKQSTLINSYMNYLSVIKNRSHHTIAEYQIDLQLFFKYINSNSLNPYDINELGYSFVDIEYVKQITLEDMYAFIAYSQDNLKNSAESRKRKIVSIRQFWRYLKTKAHLLDNNIAEELETPKTNKRLPKYMSLDESVRLLIYAERNLRNYCIITIFLNCALRLSELVSINIDQIDSNSYLYSGSKNVDDVAWYFRNSGDEYITESWYWGRIEANNSQINPIGQKQSNELDLYDMSGNVREWCWDWSGETVHSESGEQRVLRGGGWIGEAVPCEISYRASMEAHYKQPDLGFRLCRNN